MVPYCGYGVQTAYMLYLFFNFFVIVLSLLSYHYYLHDQKTRVAIFDGFKIKIDFGPTQIGVSKIGILVLKTTCIKFW